VPSNLTTVDEVVDEIYAEVKNVEPMVAGKDRLPSTAFFLLYKLFELRLTKRQMHGQDRQCETMHDTRTRTHKLKLLMRHAVGVRLFRAIPLQPPGCFSSSLSHSSAAVSRVRPASTPLRRPPVAASAA